MKLDFWRPNTCSFNRSPHPGTLALFAYLQFLDLLTTLVFLTHGVQEANPVVKFAIATTHSPVAGLLALKAAALLAAGYCAVSGRLRVLRRINLLFALLVVWNLLALLAR